MKALKTCGRNCSAKSQRKFDLTKEELELLVKTNSYEKIGFMFGVSGKSIKNRCVKMGIVLGNRQGFWSKNKNKI